MEKKILVIDIETTGFQNTGGKIVEIGGVELNLDNGEIKEVFSSLCREDGLTAKDRDAWIFQNSNLAVEEVRSAPAFSWVAERFQTVVDFYPLGLTAFNRNFDVPFLQSRGIKFGKLLPCPMLLSTPICQLPNKNRGGYKWPSVVEAYKYFFKVDLIEDHRGNLDAKFEAEIIQALYELGIFKI